MLLQISVVLTVLGIFFSKSKGLFYGITFWEWILLGFCSDTTMFDYANYVTFYGHVESMRLSYYSGTEPGFFLICKFFQLFGLSFHDAYKIMVLFIIFSVAYVVRKNTKRACLPMLLFMWYPAIMSVYNTREGIAMGIVLIAVQALIDDKHNCLLKYVILILVASSIHTSAFFYLTFIVLKLWNHVSKKKIAMIVVLGITLMLGVDNISFIQTLLGNRRFSYYFGIRHVDNMTAILSIAWQISICIIIFFLKHIRINFQQRADQQFLNEKTQENYFDYVEKIFWLLLILCPLYFYTFTYIRLARNLLVLVYIYYAKWQELPNAGLKGLKNLTFILWSVATIYGFNVIVRSDFEEVIQVFFNHNNFLQVMYDYIFGVILFIALISWGFLMDLIKYKKKDRISIA